MVSEEVRIRTTALIDSVACLLRLLRLLLLEARKQAVPLPHICESQTFLGSGRASRGQGGSHSFQHLPHSSRTEVEEGRIARGVQLKETLEPKRHFND